MRMTETINEADHYYSYSYYIYVAADIITSVLQL